MTFQSVPDTAEVLVTFDYEGRGSLFTLYGKYTGAYDLTALQDLADAVDGAVGAGIAALMTAAQDYTGTTVRGLEFENDQVAVSIAGVVSGSVSAAALPPNVTLAIRRVSGLTGRSARGRIYIPFLNQNFMQTDRNFVTQAAADAWVALLDDIDTAMIGAGWTPVIVSRYTNGAPRVFGATFNIAGWNYNDLNVDSQRRRLKPD